MTPTPKQLKILIAIRDFRLRRSFGGRTEIEWQSELFLFAQRFRVVTEFAKRLREIGCEPMQRKNLFR